MINLFNAFRATLGRSSLGECYRVLIAEDHADLANITAILLRHCGFEVRTVNDGRLVLALVGSFRPHFVLLDVKLPGLNGYEVAEQIRADHSLAPTTIIGISAYRPEPRVGAMAQDLFDRYLTKPFDLKTLLSVLLPRWDLAPRNGRLSPSDTNA